MGPGLSCKKCRRRKPAEGRVRADLVVVRQPVIDQILSMPHAGEAVLVQELVAHARVEALGKSVLHGLAWTNRVMLDAVLVAPLVESLARKFGSVVRADPARLAVQFHGTVEDAQDSPRWQGDVALERRAELRVIVDHGEDSEAAPVG